MLFCTIYFIFFFTTIKAEIEKDKIKEERSETESSIQRRFFEDLDDTEWHVSHLRDMDFDTQGCEETFQDKVKKYRETLRNDAALVEFVSGDTLRVEKQELSKGTCKRNVNTIFQTNKTKIKSESNVSHIENDKENATVSERELKAATVSIKEKQGNISITNQRRSEYQFSSVEYYDDVQDFDPSICPDTVEVITLELDQLRNYDVECESILEWRSLD